MDARSTFVHLLDRHGLNAKNETPIIITELDKYITLHDEQHDRELFDHVHRPKGDVVDVCTDHVVRKHLGVDVPYCSNCGLGADYRPIPANKPNSPNQ
jgi:hypothetical protein